MSVFSTPLLLRCFLRSYCSTAAYNPRGLQNVGFTFAIEPALAVLYGPGEDLRAARQRYVRHYNSHPFWAPLLLGVFLRVESDIAQKRLQPAFLDSLKDTTSYTLSAIGDSLFQGSLTPTWVLICACLIVQGAVSAAGVLTLALFFLAQALRLACFITGLRKGMTVLMLLRKMQLIDWAFRVKCLNAALLGFLIYLIFPAEAPLTGAALFLYVVVAGGLVWRLHVPRTALLLAVAALPALWRLAGA